MPEPIDPIKFIPGNEISQPETSSGMVEFSAVYSINTLPSVVKKYIELRNLGEIRQFELLQGIVKSFHKHGITEVGKAVHYLSKTGEIEAAHNILNLISELYPNWERKSLAIIRLKLLSNSNNEEKMVEQLKYLISFDGRYDQEMHNSLVLYYLTKGKTDLFIEEFVGFYINNQTKNLIQFAELLKNFLELCEFDCDFYLKSNDVVKETICNTLLNVANLIIEIVKADKEPIDIDSIMLSGSENTSELINDNVMHIAYLRLSQVYKYSIILRDVTKSLKYAALAYKSAIENLEQIPKVNIEYVELWFDTLFVGVFEKNKEIIESFYGELDGTSTNIVNNIKEQLKAEVKSKRVAYLKNLEQLVGSKVEYTDEIHS